MLRFIQFTPFEHDGIFAFFHHHYTRVIEFCQYAITQKNSLTLCPAQSPPANRSFFKSPRQKNRHPLFSECRFCYPIVRFDFWRKWRKFGVNPLLRAPKIKDSCGF